MAVNDALGVGVAVVIGVTVSASVGVWLALAVGVCVVVPVGVEDAVTVAVSVGVTLAGAVKVTVQPAVSAEIGLPSVSASLLICSPSALEEPGAPTALKVTRAMLTCPEGDVLLAPLKAERRVIPLVNVPSSVTGAPENSLVVPPAMDAIVTTV